MSEEHTVMFPSNKTFTTEFRGVRYEYYLTGEIGRPEDYLDLCNILRTAGPQDEVVIRINSPGGQVRTGNQIINSIQESEAKVTGFIESDCGSMATYIFLACSTWGVSEYAEFFAHTSSSGSYGKEHETFEQAAFLRKQTHKMIEERYRNFLLPGEILKIVGGGDVYLDSDEIMERLETYAAARDEQGCGNPDCQECITSEGLESAEWESSEGGFSEGDFSEEESQDSFLDNIKEMIAEAVDNALEKRDTLVPAKKVSEKLPKKTKE